MARTVIICLEIKTVYLLMTISKELANTGKQYSISSANQICSPFNKKGSKATQQIGKLEITD